MAFWAGILVGGFFVWLAIGRGFYEMWTMLFNIVIAIYAALYLTPVIVELVPAAGDTAYGNAMMLLVLAGAIFAILHVISLTFLTGQFKVSFPKIFDNLGAGILGFLAGLLVWSFVVLLISVTPFGKSDTAESFGLGPTNNPYLCWWCDLVNTAAASDDGPSAEEAVALLIEDAKGKSDPNEPVADANEPYPAAEPNQLSQ